MEQLLDQQGCAVVEGRSALVAAYFVPPRRENASIDSVFRVFLQVRIHGFDDCSIRRQQVLQIEVVVLEPTIFVVFIEPLAPFS